MCKIFHSRSGGIYEILPSIFSFFLFRLLRNLILTKQLIIVMMKFYGRFYSLIAYARNNGILYMLLTSYLTFLNIKSNCVLRNNKQAARWYTKQDISISKYIYFTLLLSIERNGIKLVDSGHQRHTILFLIFNFRSYHI